MTKTVFATIIALACVVAFGAGWALCTVCNPPQVVRPAAQELDTPRASWIKVGGQSIPVYPGDELDLTISTDKTQRDVAVLNGGRAETSGGKAFKSGSNALESLNLEAPAIDLSQGETTGGKVAYAAKGLVSNGPTMILFAGVLCVIGGMVASRWIGSTGWMVAGAGAVLILCGLLFGLFPWLAIVIPLVAVGLVVYYILRARKAGRTDTALTAVVAGVQSLKNDAAETYEAVKGAVSTAAGSDAAVVKAEVDARK